MEKKLLFPEYKMSYFLILYPILNKYTVKKKDDTASVTIKVNPNNKLHSEMPSMLYLKASII